MLHRFTSFVESRHLVMAGNTTLLGVSGGVDSVVMAHLFHRAGYPFVMAHCHFGLRAAEADEDEAFVRSLAAQFAVPCVVARFDTKAVAREQGISLQMAARKLRFEWFEEMAIDHNCSRISVGTHLDDQAETMLLNQLRGTGMAGLHGIFPIRAKVIRPLLFAKKVEIMAFAAAQGISFREDSSNRSPDYERNQLRHTVMPQLLAMNAELAETFDANAQRIRNAEQIYRAAIDSQRNELFRPAGIHFNIDVNALQELQPLQHWLYELFSPFGFSDVVLADVASDWNRQPGSRFESATHVLAFDRGTLILSPIVENTKLGILLTDATPELRQPIHLKLKTRTNQGFTPENNSRIAALDCDKLTFPLTVRVWQPGDCFVPLGMAGHKKVSDFLVDSKVPVAEKERTFVLESGGEIAWLIGHRVDNRFKIGEATQNIYLAEFIAS